MSGKASPSKAKRVLFAIDSWELPVTHDTCIKILCEKNIPKMPKHPISVARWHTCVVCGEEVHLYWHNYCYNCGQRLPIRGEK